ncbi:MAG: hypothetical protein Q4F88_07015, partial [Eubacteriales bacterium]|nr:hypothetical protein [Eubacteriales bacterium]
EKPKAEKSKELPTPQNTSQNKAKASESPEAETSTPEVTPSPQVEKKNEKTEIEDQTEKIIDLFDRTTSNVELINMIHKLVD